MNSKLLQFAVIIIFLSLSACGSEAPAHAEIFGKLTGSYCAEGYRLELNQDSTFSNFRIKPGVLTGRISREICKGNYLLEFDEESAEWRIVFKKREHKRNSLSASCTGEVVIWSKEKGYMRGDSIITLPEFFDQKEVVKGKCEID